MAEVVITKKKIKMLVITLSIALGVVFLAGLRIVKCRDDRLLIFSLNSDLAWTLLPKTIHIPAGEMHLKPFTAVGHSDGYLNYVFNDRKNIKQNLVIRGNKIQDFYSVGINYKGGIFSYNSLGGIPQKFAVEGVEFEIESFEVSNKTTESDFICATDFKEIRLTDGTIITPGTKKPYFFLKYGLDEWELYYNSDKSYFVVTYPFWEEEMHLTSIIFEKNWGKLISYEESTKDDWY